MEGQLHRLAELHRRNREEIIKCLRSTAQLHNLTFSEVIKIVSEYQPPPMRPPTPRRPSTPRRPPKETLEEANLRRIRRARDLGVDRYMKIIKTAHKPKELFDAFQGLYGIMANPAFYSIEFVDEMFKKLLSAKRGRLAGIHGHRITESSIRTNVARVLIFHQAPIEKVMTTIFSKVPTKEEMDTLYQVGIMIKLQLIPGYDENDLRVIVNRLLDIGGPELKEDIGMELI